MEPIEPIRITPPRPADRILRDRRHGERGGRRDPQEEQEPQDEAKPEDDGFPHVDVRA